jgi:hypothetical protein
VARLEKEVDTMRKSVVDLKDQIKFDQVERAEQLAVLRSHQADLQKARTETLEIASRAKFQVASYQETAKQAAADRDLRVTEKMEEIAAKAAVEAEVEKLKQEHASLVEQLDKLRNDFKSTLDANQKLVNRLKGGRSS